MTGAREPKILCTLGKTAHQNTYLRCATCTWMKRCVSLILICCQLDDCCIVGTVLSVNNDRLDENGNPTVVVSHEMPEGMSCGLYSILFYSMKNILKGCIVWIHHVCTVKC